MDSTQRWAVQLASVASVQAEASNCSRRGLLEALRLDPTMHLQEMALRALQAVSPESESISDYSDFPRKLYLPCPRRTWHQASAYRLGEFRPPWCVDDRCRKGGQKLGQDVQGPLGTRNERVALCSTPAST